jgi:hypothetical protein
MCLKVGLQRLLVSLRHPQAGTSKRHVSQVQSVGEPLQLLGVLCLISIRLILLLLQGSGHIA